MSTYQPIASVTLASAQSSVTFSGIPQTYTDLKLVIAGIMNTAVDPVTITFNGDTGSNYSYTMVYGDGSSAASTRSTNITAARAGYLGTVQGITSVDIMNYTNTVTNKTFISRGNVSNWGTTAQVSLWRSTAAITSMTIQSLSGYTFASGATFNLYGIANASLDNTAKATGGDIVTTDGTYWYHTFLSSGTFTPKSAFNCDYLVVAGGGGGGGVDASANYRVGGGGGGGGFLTSIGGSPLSVTAQAYTVTVGGGGANTTNGNNSVFSSITSTGGGRGGGEALPGSGGSGGGGSGGGTGSISLDGATASPSGQGSNGGNGFISHPWYMGGGGGGAGAVGGNGSTANAGNGGNGLSSSISGTSVTYAGGGGGAARNAFGNNSVWGTGGTGGGGRGGDENTSRNGVAGTANTGGGGGGGHPFGGNGAAGGSGIVIVRYAV